MNYNFGYIKYPEKNVPVLYVKEHMHIVEYVSKYGRAKRSILNIRPH